MGFPLEACRKAVYYTGNTGIDAAMNWIMSHMEDPGEQNSEKVDGRTKKTLQFVQLKPLLNRSFLWLAADFAAPLVLPGCSSGPGTTPTESLSEDHLATIVSMGFSRDQATKALRATVRISWFSWVVDRKKTPHIELAMFMSSFAVSNLFSCILINNTGFVAECPPYDRKSWALSSAKSEWKCNPKATQTTVSASTLDNFKGLSERASNIINYAKSYMQINSECSIVATHEGNGREEKNKPPK